MTWLTSIFKFPNKWMQRGIWAPLVETMINYVTLVSVNIQF